MRTIYELSRPSYRLSRAANEEVRMEFLENFVSVKVMLSGESAVKLKRSLAGITHDAGISVAGAQGYSIKDLVRLKKQIDDPHADDLTVDEITDVLEAYIRLIELTTPEEEIENS